MTLYLHALGHFHPENEITNRFLEELDIGTNEQWILERVGIRSRRTALPLEYIRTTRNRDTRETVGAALYTHAETGRRAAEMALARAGIAKSDIGMVIGGSSVMDMATPAEACNIARALEVEAPAFDVNSACTSFFASLYLLSIMQPERLPPYVLVVVPEALTRSVDYNDRSSAVLWGDGTVAAIVSSQVPSRARILSNTLTSSPAGADKVVVPRVGYFKQEGRQVQMFAIKKTVGLLKQLQKQYRKDGRTLHFVGHQANLRMLEGVCKQCDVPPERHHKNVEWYGNTGGASAASVISMRWDQWTDTDDVAVVGVGAGLTWSSYLLRFGVEA
ncbi:MAG: ketoacyl-ACP synthase III [Candidatus Binatia bacterium]